MTKTIEELKQRAQEVAELDRKRTQGDLEVGLGSSYGTYPIYIHVPNGEDLCLAFDDLDCCVGFEKWDALFYVHAPAMARLIADQQAKIEELLHEIYNDNMAMRHMNEQLQLSDEFIRHRGI